jgi:hypothetical protein
MVKLKMLGILSLKCEQANNVHMGDGEKRSEFLKWRRNIGRIYGQVNIWRDIAINVLMF